MSDATNEGYVYFVKVFPSWSSSLSIRPSQRSSRRRRFVHVRPCAPSSSQIDYISILLSNETMQARVHMVPCQNKFVNNARIFGGTHGMAEALGAANENQGNDTPHVHGVMAIVTPYQNKTLDDIHDSLDKDLNRFYRIKRFITHMCRDDHFDDKGHQENLATLEVRRQPISLARRTCA